MTIFGKPFPLNFGIVSLPIFTLEICVLSISMSLSFYHVKRSEQPKSMIHRDSISKSDMLHNIINLQHIHSYCVSWWLTDILYFYLFKLSFSSYLDSFWLYLGEYIAFACYRCWSDYLMILEVFEVIWRQKTWRIDLRWIWSTNWEAKCRSGHMYQLLVVVVDKTYWVAATHSYLLWPVSYLNVLGRPWVLGRSVILRDENPVT